MPWDWNPRRELAAKLRSEGKTWPQIAKETGLSLRTVEKYPDAPAFRARVREHLDACVEQAHDILRRNASRAAETLVDKLDISALSMPDAKAHEVELSAAQNILDRLGVKADQQPAQPAIEVNVDINLDLLAAAERAYLDTVRAATGQMGMGLLPGDASDAGRAALPAVPVSGRLLAGPEPSALDSQVPPGGDEPDGRG
jgi:predicted transcriptional regulator